MPYGEFNDLVLGNMELKAFSIPDTLIVRADPNHGKSVEAIVAGTRPPVIEACSVTLPEAEPLRYDGSSGLPKLDL